MWCAIVVCCGSGNSIMWCAIVVCCGSGNSICGVLILISGVKWDIQSCGVLYVMLWVG